MAKKKLKSKAEFKDDLARLTVLKDRIKEIQDRWSAMTPEEQKIVAESKNEINQINNK
jgi:predicted transcriptional regulator